MKQYTSKRIILPISILGAGVLTSLFIAGSNPSPQKSGDGATQGAVSFSNLSFRIGEMQPFSFPSSSPRLSNLTQDLASELAQNVAEENPQALLNRNDISSLAAAVNENALNLKLAEPLPSRSYSRTDIRTTPQVTAEIQLAYFRQFSEINEKHFKDVPWTLADALDLWTRNGDREPLERYIETIPGAINDLLALSPPENLAILHLQALNFWEKTLTLYAALLDLDQDPVKFFIALREAPNILDEAIFLQNAMQKKLNELTS